MSRFLCDFYVYKTSPLQIVAKYVNAILSQSEAQATANSFSKQYSPMRVCVVNRGASSGPPRAPIKSSSTALPAGANGLSGSICWVQAPQFAGQTATCPPGYSFQNGKCQPVGHQSNAEPGHGVVKCPPGTQLVNGLCVPVQPKVLQKPSRRPYTPPTVAGVDEKHYATIQFVMVAYAGTKILKQWGYKADLKVHPWAFWDANEDVELAEKAAKSHWDPAQKMGANRVCAAVIGANYPGGYNYKLNGKFTCYNGYGFTTGLTIPVAGQTITCPAGQTWDNTQKKCVTPEFHGAGDDELQKMPFTRAPLIAARGTAPQLAPVTTPSQSTSFLRPQRRVGPFESMSVLKPPTPQPNQLAASAAEYSPRLRREPGPPDQSRIRPFYNDGHVSRRLFDQLEAPGARPAQAGRSTPSPKAPSAQPPQASSNAGRLHGGLPFALGNVGDLSDIYQALTVAKYKGLLQAWGKSPGVSSPVPNYGTLTDDSSGPWNCMRDGRMLSGFAKWWNTSKGGGLSLGYFPASGPCKGILVADLSDTMNGPMYKAALDAWAVGANIVVEPGNFPSYTPPPSGGGLPPSPTPTSAGCFTDCEVKYGMASGNWNAIELAKCVAACSSSVIPGGGSSPIPVPVPVTPGGSAPAPQPGGVQDCGGPNSPCPDGQTCVGGKCQPSLPNVPSSGSSSIKSSNAGLWVAGGIALLGTAFLVFGRSKSALLLMNSMQPFRGSDVVVIEKRKSNGSLDFSSPQPPRDHAKFDTIYEWMFRDDPNAVGSWEHLSKWLKRRGWVLRKKTW